MTQAPAQRGRRLLVDCCGAVQLACFTRAA
jgi:hypothetical protein